MRPVSPYGATRGPIATASIDIAGDAAGGILTTVGAPDDLGLIRARRHACRDLTRTRPSTPTDHYYARMVIKRRQPRGVNHRIDDLNRDDNKAHKREFGRLVVA